MKVTSSLKIEMGQWDDPGDYPSNAGGGPLPSYLYPESLEGTVTIEYGDRSKDDSDEIWWCQNLGDLLATFGDIALDQLPNGVTVKNWRIVKNTSKKVVLEPDYFEDGMVDVSYYEPPEPDEPEWEPDYDD